MTVSAHNALMNTFFTENSVYQTFKWKVSWNQTANQPIISFKSIKSSYISLSLHHKQELLFKKTGQLKFGAARRHVKKYKINNM